MILPANTVSVSSGPSVGPVTRTEAKTHLRVDIADEDDLIDRLIAASSRYCEQVSGRAFITQTLTGGLSGWPIDGVIRLPYPPLQSVTSIAYVDTAGDSANVSSAVYGVDTKLGLIYVNYGQSWPSTALRPYDPITVTWVSGYGAAAAAVPEGYKQALLLMVGHLYENRESVVIGQGYTPIEVPLAVNSLLMVDRAY